MRYFLRTRWPVMMGGVMAGAVLATGHLYSDELHEWLDWRVFGIDHDVWGVAVTIIALALVGQLAVSSRSSLQRERRLVRTAAELREVSAELDRLARTDSLTGIANRRAFFELLGVEFRRSKRYGRDMSVLMLDLDHFKVVNDTWGHGFGDYVLQHLARVISANLRDSDVRGRYGGEEFSVVLPETDGEQAVQVAEKLRRAIETTVFRTEGVPPASAPQEGVPITISIGVAALPVEADQDEVELMRRADQALYEAKRTGRNKVVLFSRELVNAPEQVSQVAASAGDSSSAVAG